MKTSTGKLAVAPVVIGGAGGAGTRVIVLLLHSPDSLGYSLSVEMAGKLLIDAEIQSALERFDYV